MEHDHWAHAIGGFLLQHEFVSLVAFFGFLIAFVCVIHSAPISRIVKNTLPPFMRSKTWNGGVPVTTYAAIEKLSAQVQYNADRVQDHAEKAAESRGRVFKTLETMNGTMAHNAERLGNVETRVGILEGEKS